MELPKFTTCEQIRASIPDLREKLPKYIFSTYPDITYFFLALTKNSALASTASPANIYFHGEKVFDAFCRDVGVNHRVVPPKPYQEGMIVLGAAEKRLDPIASAWYQKETDILFYLGQFADPRQQLVYHPEKGYIVGATCLSYILTGVLYLPKFLKSMEFQEKFLSQYMEKSAMDFSYLDFGGIVLEYLDTQEVPLWLRMAYPPGTFDKKLVVEVPPPPAPAPAPASPQNSIFLYFKGLDMAELCRFIHYLPHPGVTWKMPSSDFVDLAFPGSNSDFLQLLEKVSHSHLYQARYTGPIDTSDPYDGKYKIIFRSLENLSHLLKFLATQKFSLLEISRNGTSDEIVIFGNKGKICSFFLDSWLDLRMESVISL